MALLSEDLGADTPSVAVMQTAASVRDPLFPTLLKLYFRLVGFGS